MASRHLYTHKIIPRWSDFDQYGHVNNATYLTYFEDARLHFLREICQWDFMNSSIVITKATIDFKSPILYESTLKVNLFCNRMGNSSFDFIYEITESDEGSLIYATGLTVIVTIDNNTGKPVPVPDNYRKLIEP